MQDGEPRHSIYGTTLTDWIAQVPAELKADAVGLFQPVVAGTEGFGLDGIQLDDFVRRCIVALLDAGAVPTIALDNRWPRAPGYNGSSEEIASQIVGQWRRGEIRADHDGLWFVKH